MAKNSKTNHVATYVDLMMQHKFAKIMRLLVSSALLRPDELNRLKHLDDESLRKDVIRKACGLPFVDPEITHLLFTMAKHIGSIDGNSEQVIEERLADNNKDPVSDLNTAGLEVVRNEFMIFAANYGLSGINNLIYMWHKLLQCEDSFPPVVDFIEKDLRKLESNFRNSQSVQDPDYQIFRNTALRNIRKYSERILSSETLDRLSDLVEDLYHDPYSVVENFTILDEHRNISNDRRELLNTMVWCLKPDRSYGEKYSKIHAYIEPKNPPPRDIKPDFLFRDPLDEDNKTDVGRSLIEVRSTIQRRDKDRQNEFSRLINKKKNFSNNNKEGR
jgi:uncharacterized protein YutE (UPF0331/DUF86 family)